MGDAVADPPGARRPPSRERRHAGRRRRAHRVVPGHVRPRPRTLPNRRCRPRTSNQRAGPHHARGPRPRRRREDLFRVRARLVLGRGRGAAPRDGRCATARAPAGQRPRPAAGGGARRPSGGPPSRRPGRSRGPVVVGGRRDRRSPAATRSATFATGDDGRGRHPRGHTRAAIAVQGPRPVRGRGRGVLLRSRAARGRARHPQRRLTRPRRCRSVG